MQLSLFRSEPPPQKKEPGQDPLTGMRKTILPHIPEEAISFVIDWLITKRVQLRISAARSTKLGDYRAPRAGTIPKISVNHSLNPYSFLITLVHEMAHHEVFLSHVSAIEHQSIFTKRKKTPPKPHGMEWKLAYRELIKPLLKPTIFPSDILQVLHLYFENPRASSKADKTLSGVLKRYDPPDGKVVVESLPFDGFFHLPGGRKFQKKERVRTRYRCLCVKTKRVYLFNPLAEVFPA